MSSAGTGKTKTLSMRIGK
ncbi:hypothetical protein JQ038_08980 [Clostridium botulinum]|nr:hypothetical protein [Clostridium botulinum]